MENIIKTLERLIKEKEELFNALKSLWNVRGTPFTLEQTQQQEKVYKDVEKIIKRYSLLK